MKTYSNKSNAKRAAINHIAKEHGLDKDYVKANEANYFDIKQADSGFYIEYVATVAVNGETLVDFADNDEPMVHPEVKQEAVQTVEAVTPTSTKGIKIEANREERNGITMPSAGTRCRAVWDECQSAYDNGTLITPKVMREIASEQGWNENNSIIEMYQWRKFNGIIGRQKPVKKD